MSERDKKACDRYAQLKGLPSNQFVGRLVTEDMDKVEKLILPLLYNLMKNPEKDYIYWPNREEIINKQIARIQDITQDL